MDNVINKARGSFVRLHGIFGITHIGMMIFTSEAIIVTNKKDIKYNQFSKEDAEDVLYYGKWLKNRAQEKLKNLYQIRILLPKKHV